MDLEAILAFIFGWIDEKLRRLARTCWQFTRIILTRPTTRPVMVAIFLPVATIAIVRLVEDGVITKPSTKDRMYRFLVGAYEYVERHETDVRRWGFTENEVRNLEKRGLKLPAGLPIEKISTWGAGGEQSSRA